MEIYYSGKWQGRLFLVTSLRLFLNIIISSMKTILLKERWPCIKILKVTVMTAWKYLQWVMTVFKSFYYCIKNILKNMCFWLVSKGLQWHCSRDNNLKFLSYVRYEIFLKMFPNSFESNSKFIKRWIICLNHRGLLAYKSKWIVTQEKINFRH